MHVSYCCATSNVSTGTPPIAGIHAVHGFSNQNNEFHYYFLNKVILNQEQNSGKDQMWLQIFI